MGSSGVNQDPETPAISSRDTDTHRDSAAHLILVEAWGGLSRRASCLRPSQAAGATMPRLTGTKEGRDVPLRGVTPQGL